MALFRVPGGRPRPLFATAVPFGFATCSEARKAGGEPPPSHHYLDLTEKICNYLRMQRSEVRMSGAVSGSVSVPPSQHHPTICYGESAFSSVSTRWMKAVNSRHHVWWEKQQQVVWSPSSPGVWVPAFCLWDAVSCL